MSEKKSAAVKAIEAGLKKFKAGQVTQIIVPKRIEEETEISAHGVKEIHGIVIKPSARVNEDEAWLCDAARNILARVCLKEAPKPAKPKPPTPTTEPNETTPPAGGEGAETQPPATETDDQSGQ